MPRKSRKNSHDIMDVERQVNLLSQLKQHLETICRQIGEQRKCLQSVDKFEKICRQKFYELPTQTTTSMSLSGESAPIFKEENDMSYNSVNVIPYEQAIHPNFVRNNNYPIDLKNECSLFIKHYQYLRKRCQKLEKLNTLSSVYDILYNLYENCGEFNNYYSGNKSSSLNEHNVKRKKRKYKKKFDKYTLIMSENIYSIERDGLLYYVCPFEDCKKEYKIRDNLLRHIQKHSLLQKASKKSSRKRQLKSAKTGDSNSNDEHNKNSLDFENLPKSIRKRKSKCPKMTNSLGLKSVPPRKRITQNEMGKKQRKPREAKNDANTTIYHCDAEGCTYVSKYKSGIELHKNKHSLDRPFQCEICDKTFKNVYALRMHTLIHNNQRFECPFDGCNAIYSWYYTLKKHIRVHTNQAPVHRCDWPGCDYQSHRPDLLRKHRTRHTGERKFPCNWPDCGKAFKTESGLFDHLSMHKNERKHACTWPGCNYRCNLPGNLRKHIAIHEKKMAKSSIPGGNTGMDDGGDSVMDPPQILVPHQTMLIQEDHNMNFH